VLKAFSKEIRIGLFAVVALTMLVMGVKFLKGNGFLSSNATYFSEFDNVGGLTEGNSVSVRGLAIGRVKSIVINPTNSSKILVEIEIDKNIKVPTNSRLVLAADGLLGGKLMNLELGNATTYMPENASIPNITDGGMMETFGSIGGKVDPILTKADSIAITLNLLLKDFRVTSAVLNQTLSSVGTSSNKVNDLLVDNQQNIKGITGNINTLTNSLTDTEKKVKDLMVKLNTLGDTINKAEVGSALRATQQSLSELTTTLKSVNKGEGTMGQFAKNDSLYRNLNASSEALAKLLNDFRERPKRYVHFSLFGKKDKK
jgi:phospholipid/cholesterol/gamma-HCH transport system substrate-binding protein